MCVRCSACVCWWCVFICFFFVCVCLYSRQSFPFRFIYIKEYMLLYSVDGWRIFLYLLFCIPVWCRSYILLFVCLCFHRWLFSRSGSVISQSNTHARTHTHNGIKGILDVIPYFISSAFNGMIFCFCASLRVVSFQFTIKCISCLISSFFFQIAQAIMSNHLFPVCLCVFPKQVRSRLLTEQH